MEAGRGNLRKNNHTASGYSDYILEKLELGEFSGKFKDDWRRKLSDFDENSTYFSQMDQISFTGNINFLVLGLLCFIKKFGRHGRNFTDSVRPSCSGKEIKILHWGRTFQLWRWGSLGCDRSSSLPLIDRRGVKKGDYTR